MGFGALFGPFSRLLSGFWGPAPGAQWPKSCDATAMCDAIRIAHPQIASDAKKFFPLAMRKTGKCQKKSPRKSCDVGLRCEKSGCFLRSSDAKCLRFGLPLQFGLRCEHPQCQIASDVDQAMRTTKPGSLPRLLWRLLALAPRLPLPGPRNLKPPVRMNFLPLQPHVLALKEKSQEGSYEPHLFQIGL